MFLFSLHGLLEFFCSMDLDGIYVPFQSSTPQHRKLEWHIQF